MHHGAHGTGGHAIARRCGAVDLQFPIDTGRRQATVDVNHIRYFSQAVRHLLCHGIQSGRVGGGQLDLNGFAGRRTRRRNRHFDIHTGDPHHRRPQIGQDGVGILAFPPVDEFILNDPDHIGGDIVAGPSGFAGPGVDRGDAGPTQNPLFSLAHQRVFLLDRQVATRLDIQQAEIRFDIGEELDTAAELAIAIGHSHQQTDRQKQHDERMAHCAAHHPHIGTVAVSGRFLERLGDDRPQHRHKDQRIKQRRRQGDDQGDRHVFHEFADDAGPEQQRRKRGDAGHGGGNHRPRHAVRRQGKRRALFHAFGHPAFGKFGDDDRIIDQHSHRQDQRKQHDDVDGKAKQRQQQHPHQERRRNSQPDQDRGAARQGEQDHDEHQDHRCQHRVLQVGQQLPDILGFVLAE